MDQVFDNGAYICNCQLELHNTAWNILLYLQRLIFHCRTAVCVCVCLGVCVCVGGGGSLKAPQFIYSDWYTLIVNAFCIELNRNVFNQFSHAYSEKNVVKCSCHGSISTSLHNYERVCFIPYNIASDNYRLPVGIHYQASMPVNLELIGWYDVVYSIGKTIHGLS